MQPILLPSLPTLPKSLTQMPQEKFQVLRRLWKRVFERLVQLLHTWLLLGIWSVRDFRGDEIEVFMHVGHVESRVGSVAGFDVAWDYGGAIEGRD
jgi:hypothetical protein